MGRKAVNVTADTNVLVRAVVGDHAGQRKIAQAELGRADTVAVSTTALCELVWVLSQGYKIPAGEIADAIRLLIGATNVNADRPAVEAGLAVLAAGGDFADGVIAFDGKALGGETFISFDKRAVKLLQARGAKARLLA